MKLNANEIGDNLNENEMYNRVQTVKVDDTSGIFDRKTSFVPSHPGPSDG